MKVYIQKQICIPHISFTAKFSLRCGHKHSGKTELNWRVEWMRIMRNILDHVIVEIFFKKKTFVHYSFKEVHEANIKKSNKSRDGAH